MRTGLVIINAKNNRGNVGGMMLQCLAAFSSLFIYLLAWQYRHGNN